jgi:hypothetical protein
MDFHAGNNANCYLEGDGVAVHSCWILQYVALFINHVLKGQILILYIAVKPIGPIIQFPSQLSRTTLPPPHTLLFGGNFMVLDTHVKPQGPSSDEKPSSENSYAEIGFGDDRKDFAGMHRFEVSRPEKEGVEISFSSVSVNPSMNEVPFSNLVFVFHKFYAQSLFRDAIREVLSD